MWRAVVDLKGFPRHLRRVEDPKYRSPLHNTISPIALRDQYRADERIQRRMIQKSDSYGILRVMARTAHRYHCSFWTLTPIACDGGFLHEKAVDETRAGFYLHVLTV